MATGKRLNKKNDLLGLRVGKLTVGERIYEKVWNQTKYNCKCDCGKTTIIQRGNLLNKTVNSCGCSKIDKNLIEFKNNYENKKYYKLTIIGINKEKLPFSEFICRCDCGNIKNISKTLFNTKKIKSCGCYRKEMGSKLGINNPKQWNQYKWYYLDKNNNKQKCRSGYEVIFANYLVKNNIDFLYEPQTFKIGNGERYTPDFYLIEENLYIEVKGTFNNTRNQKEKIEKFKLIKNIEIYYWEDLRKICGINYCYKTLFNKAKIRKEKIEKYLGEKFYDTLQNR